MSDETNEAVTRRQFTSASVMALLGGISVTLSGCGGGGGSSAPAAPSAQPGDVVGNVSANHGHSAIIRAAQVMAGNSVALDIRGTADHPHTVELSANDVVQIAAGQRVTRVSSVDQAHDHSVTFN